MFGGCRTLRPVLALAGLACFTVGCAAMRTAAPDGGPAVLPDEASAFAVSRAAPRAGEGGMTRELRDRIDALVADYAEGGPTTPETAIERALTLYDWGNAMALDGLWTHPQLTSLVSVITQPGALNPRNPALPGFMASVDNFIQEFDLRARVPDAFGPIEATILKPAFVASYHSVEMTYTVGREPIRPGGGVVAPNHFRFAEFEYQTDDPSAENYVTVRSSNPEAVFVVDSFPASGQYAPNLFRLNVPRLFFRLAEGTLNRGDTITVTFGDMSEGSPGLRTLHYSNSAMRYPVWVLTSAQAEGGILHSLPEVPVPLLGGPATAVRGFGPAMAAVGETVEITVRTEDRFRNRAEADIPARYTVTLNGAPFDDLDTDGRAVFRFPVAFDEPGVYRFAFVSSDGQVRGEADPVLVEEDPETRIYWGETHAHSGWAEGLGLIDPFFEFGREEARLDFITLSEHDLWMDLGEWAQMKDMVERHHRPGEYITFTGYEWTVDATFGGHHNVLFRDPETAVLVARQRHPVIEQMHESIKKAIPAEDVIVVPHAHQPGDWKRSDHDLERLVEIVSYHGTFEWFGKRYLDEGWEVGFIGSSDDHVGSPGYRPGAFGREGSDNFGGLAAVYASRKDRDSIFDSLRDRRTFATNGARMLLFADMNGQRMGTRLPEGEDAYTLSGRIIGTGEIAEVTLVKNGHDMETLDYVTDSEGAIIEIGLHFDSDPRELRPSYPDATFIGTLSFDGIAVDRVETPVAQALNREAEFARLNAEGGVDFSLRSGGRLNTIELRPDGTPDGDATIAVDLSKSRLALWETIPDEPVVLSLADLAEGPVTKRLDGEDGFYTLSMRRISRPEAMERRFTFIDNSPSETGDYYYVRIRQMDGGMAWSSPWWVGEPRKRAHRHPHKH